MASESIPHTCAEAQFVQVADSEGRLLLMPTAMVNHFLATGISSLNLTVSLQPDKAAQPWLSITEAARCCLDDIDGMTLEKAKARISRACGDGRIQFKGSGTNRRVEPDSFAAWRLAARESDLKKVDS